MSDIAQAFDTEALELTAAEVVTQQKLQHLRDAQFEACLGASDMIAYHWDIASDRLQWSGNSAALLGCPSERVATGRDFASFLDADNMTSRFDVVMNAKGTDSGTGVPYRIEYQFRPEGRKGLRSMWFEDSGRWHAGSNGRPVSAYGMMRRMDDRQISEQYLANVATTDSLTGMINRARIIEMLSEVIVNANRERTSCAFAIAAISNMAVVNESYGFEIADEVIAAIGQRLRQVMRSGDAIARYSGSRFAFIFNNCNVNDLPHALERLLAVIRESVVETSKGPVWPSLAIGAVSLPDKAQETSAAIACAEEALNEARSRSADAAVVYEQSEARKASQMLNARCASEVVRCLKEESFKLAFQPVHDAQTGEILMYEALLRLIDSAGEIIPAGHLIPVSEKIGLVKLIDRSVLQMAITTLHSNPAARLSVNISAGSVADPRWSRQLVELLETDPKIARRIIVEIPEMVAVGEDTDGRAFVNELRRVGCGIAIDDFGAGYTSFRSIKDLPVDYIKLDGSFCRELGNSDASRYFARCLIDLGKAFGVKTIAEWVETEEDANILRSLGVDCMQGHYFGDANIELPWIASQSSAFELEPVQTSSAIENQPAPHAASMEQIEENQLFAPSDAIAPRDDDDDGIATLRATLDLLDQYFPRDTGSTDKAA